MSMLAEARKKSKYSTNPRGTHWANDDDKFGQKLMEKFGWQKGKGLGANEDGRVEHVRASKKTDAKGFGFKKNNSDNWISHQDDFNSLLSELNASHGSTTDNQGNDEKIISNLEEKSKSSKRRVHYHKHAKWKDLSGRSAEEMDCIFGRKKSKIRKEKKEVLQNAEETAEGEPKKDTPEKTEHGVQTVQSTQSCQEYFAMKMAQLKAKRSGQQVSPAYVPQEEVMEEQYEDPASEETSPADPEAMGWSHEEKTESVDGEKSKKKKKKKSKEKERLEEEEEDDCNNSPLEIEENENGEKSKKKKRKLKEKERREEEEEDDCNSPSLEPVQKENVDSPESEADKNCDENPSSKKAKKSKKKRSKECIDEVEEIPVAEDNELEAVEADLATKPRKKKHLKKCKGEISEPDTNAADGEILESSSVCDGETGNSINTETAESSQGGRQSKGKKRKRTKDETEAADNVTTESDDILDKSNNASHLSGDNDEEPVASSPKKKKSSKKSKPEAGEDEDSSASDEMETHAEVSGPAVETQGAETSSADASNSPSKNSPQRIPENKQEIKRNPYAVNTASKSFQKAGANVDTISGYGHSVE